MTEDVEYHRESKDDPHWAVLLDVSSKTLTSIIGREAEVTTISTLLRREAVRLLTLTGTGGVGKTSLALVVARNMQGDFPDGIRAVDLSAIYDAELVLPALAQAMRIPLGPGPILESMGAYLREKELLLLLDNFEQVLAAAPDLVALLNSCPHLTLLVTSRSPLHVRGEYEFSLSPLPLPDLSRTYEVVDLLRNPAIALFVERAQAFKPDFWLTEANAGAVAQICVQLDGLPLALELAAARIKLLPPKALLQRLSSRLTLLTAGLRDAPARQQSLRQTIQWSYDLLTGEEQALFRRICVFIGNFRLEAVEAIVEALAEDPAAIVDRMASLLDKSLIQEAMDREEEAHFVLLETIREFGLECLKASGEMVRVRLAHVQYYLSWAETSAQALYGHQQVSTLRSFVKELSNLRTVMHTLLEQRDETLALRFGTALGRFWLLWGFHHQQGYLLEGKRFLEQALALGEEPLSLAGARVLSIYGTILTGLGEGEHGEACCREALMRLRQSDHIPSIMSGLWMLTQVLITRSDYLAARQPAEEALSLARLHSEQYTEWGADWTLGYSLFLAGHVATWNGRYVEARSLLEASRVRCSQAGDLFFTTWSRLILGQMAGVEGRIEEARPLLEESRAIFGELGMRTRVAAALRSLGGLALMGGQIEEAQALLWESRKLGEEVNDLQSIAWAQVTLAKVACLQQQLDEARSLLQDTLEKARKIGDRFVMAAALEGIGGIVMWQGEPARAVRIWGTAQALREAIGTPRFPVEQPFYEATIAAARTRLGEAHFQTAWQQGLDLTPEQALSPNAAVEASAAAPLQPVEKPHPRSASGGLSRREMDVLRLLAEGGTNAQIAADLMLSTTTVNAYLRSIYNKLGVSSRTQALHTALKRNLL